MNFVDDSQSSPKKSSRNVSKLAKSASNDVVSSILKKSSRLADEPIDSFKRRNSIVSVSGIIVAGKNEGDELGPEASQVEKDSIKRSIEEIKIERYM